MSDYDAERGDFRVPGIACLSCGETIDGAAPVDQDADDPAAPAPGAVSLCFYCGNLAVFELHPVGYLYLRPPTDDERTAMLADPQIVRAMAGVRAFHEGEPVAFGIHGGPCEVDDFAEVVASADVVVCLGRSVDVLRTDDGRIGSAVSARLFNMADVPKGAIAAALRVLADSFEQ